MLNNYQAEGVSKKINSSLTSVEMTSEHKNESFNSSSDSGLEVGFIDIQLQIADNSAIENPLAWCAEKKSHGLPRHSKLYKSSSISGFP